MNMFVKGEIIRLVGKTEFGKDIINEFGDEWVVTGINNTTKVANITPYNSLGSSRTLGLFMDKDFGVICIDGIVGYNVQEFGNDGSPKRNFDLAVKQLSETIRNQLLLVPVGMKPVEGLTDKLVDNLARNIVASLDEYGRED